MVCVKRVLSERKHYIPKHNLGGKNISSNGINNVHHKQKTAGKLRGKPTKKYIARPLPAHIK